MYVYMHTVLNHAKRKTISKILKATQRCVNAASLCWKPAEKKKWSSKRTSKTGLIYRLCMYMVQELSCFQGVSTETYKKTKMPNSTSHTHMSSNQNWSCRLLEVISQHLSEPVQIQRFKWGCTTRILTGGKPKIKTTFDVEIRLV